VVFPKIHFGMPDLKRFGVLPDSRVGKPLFFPLFHRPPILLLGPVEKF